MAHQRTHQRIIIPSPDAVRAAQTGNGGWTKDQLAKWGVPWPPPKGWKKKLEERHRNARLRGRFEE